MALALRLRWALDAASTAAPLLHAPASVAWSLPLAPSSASSAAPSAPAGAVAARHGAVVASARAARGSSGGGKGQQETTMALQDYGKMQQYATHILEGHNNAITSTGFINKGVETEGSLHVVTGSNGHTKRTWRSHQPKEKLGYHDGPKKDMGMHGNINSWTLALALLIEFEPQYHVNFANPDIDEKPPMSLEEVLQKVKPFIVEYEGIQNQEEWELFSSS